VIHPALQAGVAKRGVLPSEAEAILRRLRLQRLTKCKRRVQGVAVVTGGFVEIPACRPARETTWQTDAIAALQNGMNLMMRFLILGLILWSGGPLFRRFMPDQPRRMVKRAKASIAVAIVVALGVVSSSDTAGRRVYPRLDASALPDANT